MTSNAVIGSPWDTTGPAWSTCPSCGTHYLGFHNCLWKAPAAPVYVQAQPWRLSDEDVERIADRVIAKLQAKEN